MVTEKDKPGRLLLTNDNDPDPIPIQRLSPDDANIGLVFRMAQSGCQRLEISHSTKQSNHIAFRVNKTPLSPTEVWVL